MMRRHITKRVVNSLLVSPILSKFNCQQVHKSKIKPTEAAILKSSNRTIFHAFSKKNELPKLVNTVKDFRESSLGELEKSIVFKSLDRLYLYNSAEEHEINKHKDIKEIITENTRLVNEHRSQKARFDSLNEYADGRIGKFLGFKEASEQLNLADSLLTRTKSILEYADSLNSAELDFKQRLFSSAQTAVNNCLKTLEENPSIELIGKNRNWLFAHTHNLAAKIARCQENYDQSDLHYEKAKKYFPGDIYILYSQLALWSDMAWNSNTKKKEIKLEPKKIKDFLLNEKESEKYINLGKQKKYSLGLANLSWIYILPTQSNVSLGLEEETKISFLEKALELAEEAIEIITAKKHRGADNSSINPWLFRGIAKYELAVHKYKNNHEDKQKLLISALEEFEERLKSKPESSHRTNPDHPSLLRRKAMALRALNRKNLAYLAYQDLKIELQYRITCGDTEEKHKEWLEEAKEHLAASAESAFHIIAGDFLQKIKNLLVSEKYSAAYDCLKMADNNMEKVKKEELEKWFLRHFTITDGRLSPKVRDTLLRNWEIDNLPTPDTFIRLSNATYYAKHGRPLGVPSEWKELCTYPQIFTEDEPTGYLAAAFLHIPSGQIVIAHGGTDTSDRHDLMTDVELSLGKPYRQLRMAQEFTKYVVNTYYLGEKTAENIKERDAYIIYHTGHSLGGSIAAYMACTANRFNYRNERGKIWPHYAVTFDNPSCYWQLNKASGDRLSKLPRKEQQYVDFPITAYLNQPTFINCAGGAHLGQIIKIHINTGKSQLPQEIIREIATSTLVETIGFGIEVYLKKFFIFPESMIRDFGKNLNFWRARLEANIACHDKELIQQVFSSDPSKIYDDPGNVYYASRWPRDLQKWFEFEQKPAILGNENFQPVVLNKKKLIPLSALEKGLRNLLPSILDPAKKEKLQGEEEIISSYFHSDFFHWAALSKGEKGEEYLEISGPLSSWEMLGYIRGRISKACQEKHINYDRIMYPELAKWLILIERPESIGAVYKKFGMFAKTPVAESAEKNHSTEDKASPGVKNGR